MLNIGIILCGNGRFDGSEIHETTIAMLHLVRAGVELHCFAPDAPQWATCDHFDGCSTPETARNMLAESGRLARGDIQPLSAAKVSELDALVIPGGSGAVKNLCDFAAQGGNGEVIPELGALLRDFHAAGKPIAAICIAPAILALALGDHGPTITLGACDGVALEAAAAGANMVECAVDHAIVDEKNLIVTTPAYILGSDIGEVDAGIDELVRGLLRLLATSPIGHA